MIKIYTDGSAIGNPWPWWRWAIIHGRTETKLSWWKEYTTNNVMELIAVIEALEWVLKKYSWTQIQQETGLGLFGSDIVHDIPHVQDTITIYTDSTYVQKWITQWIHTWIKRDRRKSKGWQMISNVELWQRLYTLTLVFDELSWQRVKAHVWNRYNEEVDDLARAQAKCF